MGNYGAKEVTLEINDGEFIQTGDGIRLSSSMVGKMVHGPAAVNYKESPKLLPNDQDYKEALETETNKLKQHYQEILDQREKELSRLAEKRRMELENERAKNEKFYQLTIDEYQKAASDVEKKFKRPDFQPVCENLQNVLTDCYSKNPGKSLICSEHLKEFEKCVNNKKEAFLRNSQLNGPQLL